jgi:heme-degrading monooxygenase HmoA
MHARVARYDVDPERVEDAIKAFQEAGTGLQELEGLIGGYLLIEPDTGKTISLTLWDHKTALETGGTRAASLRQRAIREVDGQVQSVEEYEVALEFGGYTRDVRE